MPDVINIRILKKPFCDTDFEPRKIEPVFRFGDRNSGNCMGEKSFASTQYYTPALSTRLSQVQNFV